VAEPSAKDFNPNRPLDQVEIREKAMQTLEIADSADGNLTKATDKLFKEHSKGLNEEARDVLKSELKGIESEFIDKKQLETSRQRDKLIEEHNNNTECVYKNGKIK
jgi:hypothetical protein